MDIKKIKKFLDSPKGKVTIGLDGFVDEVWQILRQRTSSTEYQLFEKMSDFAKSVYDTGAGGYANEIIRKRRSYGGCASNTGKAAGRLGCDLTLLGMFGKDTIDPVFKEFEEFCKLLSIADPSISQIFEFSDGKLMLPFTVEGADFNWEDLTNRLSEKQLADAMDSDIVSIGYWSQLNHFDDIVANLCERYLVKGRCKRMFFDFADIRKRDRRALEVTLEVLAGFNQSLPMTLSLNEHEAGILFSYKGRSFDWKNPDGAEADLEYVREQIGLDEVVIHTPYFAVAATATEGTATAMQHYCEDPVITTGAGDNFNGGYITASLGDLSLEERLLTGNSTTGFYIQNGYSPGVVELKNTLLTLAASL